MITIERLSIKNSELSSSDQLTMGGNLGDVQYQPSTLEETFTTALTEGYLSVLPAYCVLEKTASVPPSADRVDNETVEEGSFINMLVNRFFNATDYVNALECLPTTYHTLEGTGFTQFLPDPVTLNSIDIKLKEVKRTEEQMKNINQDVTDRLVNKGIENSYRLIFRDQ